MPPTKRITINSSPDSQQLLLAALAIYETVILLVEFFRTVNFQKANVIQYGREAREVSSKAREVACYQEGQVAHQEGGEGEVTSQERGPQVADQKGREVSRKERPKCGGPQEGG